MNILLPIAVTDSMFMAGTNVPAVDVDAGEIAWLASGNYVIDDLRVYAGAVYSCVKEHAATAASPKPDVDPERWLFKWPSNRMAPFDEYIYTRAKKAPVLRYVLRPGFFTGFAMYGVEADEIEVTLLEEAGGVELWHDKWPMWEQAFGLWEYLFGNLRRETKFTKNGLPLRPASELDLTLRRNSPSVAAELGYLAVGQWRTFLAPRSDQGGSEWGAEVSPKSYAYFKRMPDGTYTRRTGRQADVITASVLIDASQAAAAKDLLRRILDIPVAVEVSDVPGYGYLSTVGFVTGTVRAEGVLTARVTIKVEGNV